MASPRRVLVTGGNGLLGTKLLAHLLSLDGIAPVSASLTPCANRGLGGFAFFHLDVADKRSVRAVIEAVRPEVVVHAAAMTDVDGCERDPQACWRVNADGTANLAELCARRGVRLVYLSTEYVFDGRSGPYGEHEQPHPLGHYGRSKLAGEAAVQARCQSWAVARTTVLYGYAPHVRPNFVLWLVERLRARHGVRVAADQIGSPTLVDNLAQMVAALALSGESGIFNTVGASVIDRYRFACLAAQVFGLDAGLIQPVTTAELGQLAARPLQAGLKMDRFRRAFPQVAVLDARQGLEALRKQLEPDPLPGGEGR